MFLLLNWPFSLFLPSPKECLKPENWNLRQSKIRVARDLKAQHISTCIPTVAIAMYLSGSLLFYARSAAFNLWFRFMYVFPLDLISMKKGKGCCFPAAPDVVTLVAWSWFGKKSRQKKAVRLPACHKRGGHFSQRRRLVRQTHRACSTAFL